MVIPRAGNEAVHLDLTDRDEPQPRIESPPPPVELISGDMLCRLTIWNDQQWAALTERQRPRDFARIPGLGWVGAVPIAGLN